MENTREHRQRIGCGYEPPIELAPGAAWCHPGWNARSEDDLPKFCAGYTTKLPEVIEAAHARMFFEKGELRAFCDGAQPSESLKAAIATLEVAAAEMKDWLLTPASKGGGGHG